MNLVSNFLLVLFLCISTAESASTYYYCNDNSKTSPGSQIPKDVNNLLSLIKFGTAWNGFIVTSFSQVYGLGQCRGDVSPDDCSTCIADAASEISDVCPNRADARIWYDNCFLRYSTERFFDKVDTSGVYFYNVQNVADPDSFNIKLSALMDQVSSQAILPASKGMGKGKTDISSFVRLYALVQCTGDLSQVHCAQCLAFAISNFPTVCANKKGCRVLYSSCYVRYELYPIYSPHGLAESLKHSSEKYKLVTAFKP